jgi:hypothetical protein
MQHPAVHTASPVLSVYVRPADHETPFCLIGIDPILDRDLRRWTVQSPGEGGGRLGVDDDPALFP